MLEGRGSERRRAAAFTIVLGSWIAAVTAAQEPTSHVLGRGGLVFDSRWHAQSFAEVRAGGRHTAALGADGTIVSWGAGFQEQSSVVPLPIGLEYVQVGESVLFHPLTFGRPQPSGEDLADVLQLLAARRRRAV